MDWQSKPTCPKSYPDLPRLKLQPIESLSDASLSNHFPPPNKKQQVTLVDLSNLLFLAYSVTAQYRGMGEALRLLSCPSAGALYPCEIYIQAEGIGGLSDGLYHYNPFAYELRLLRQSTGTSWGLTFYITAIFHRAVWKYGSRAYRYCLLDTGHLLENLLRAAMSLGIELQPCYVFPDQETNRQLCLDPQREACLAAATSDPAPLPPAGQLQADESALIAASRCAKDDLPPEGLMQVHAATSRPFLRPLDLTPLASGFPKPSTSLGAYAQATRHRRSQRKFTLEKLAHTQFDMLLSLLAGLQVDRVVRLGILAERVQGLAPGLYSLESDSTLKHLLAGPMANELASACLGQAWMAQAALIVMIWADLPALEQELGPRAYRLAHLLSGQLGQRAYLAASALSLGCCAIGAFYDTEADQVLGLSPDEQLLYLLAFGPSRK
jgi:SagB-type dehydrogenase family enzyme